MGGGAGGRAGVRACMSRQTTGIHIVGIHIVGIHGVGIQGVSIHSVSIQGVGSMMHP